MSNDPTQPYVNKPVLFWETDTICSPAVVQAAYAERVVDLVVFRALTPNDPPCRHMGMVSFQQEPAEGSWTVLDAQPGGA